MSGVGTETPDAAFAKAEALLRAGRGVEAEGVLRALLARRPDHPGATHYLGLLAKERGALEEAEALMRRAILLAPGEASFHNNLGNLMRARSDLPAAESLYRRAVALMPSYAEAHFNLGLVLKERGQSEAALASFSAALQLNPSYAEAHTQMAVLLRDARRFDEALHHLDAALNAKPKHFSARYYRGTVLAAAERHAEAVPEFTRALAINPKSHEAHYALGNSLQYLGRLDEALQAYNVAIGCAPGFIPAHNDFNLLAWTMGRKDLHGRSYAYARRAIGDDPGLLLGEAELRMKFNQHGAAERLLRTARERGPERADIAACLARALSAQGKFEESYPFFDAAIAAEPDRVEHRQAMAIAHLRHGQPREALHLFEGAQRISPFDQLTLGGIALACRELGDARYSALVDPERYVRVYEIPAPAHGDTAAFNAALADDLRALHTRVVEPFDQTLRNGTQTVGRLFSHPSRLVGEVRDAIAEAVADYVRHLDPASGHPTAMRKRDAFSFFGSWSCRLRSSGYHTNHVHTEGWISSAYYVDVPDEVEDADAHPGWLKFGESNLALGERDRPGRFVKPRVGRLVLFPSFYWHGTVPFVSNRDRLTIAFDVVPA